MNDLILMFMAGANTVLVCMLFFGSKTNVARFAFAIILIVTAGLVGDVLDRELNQSETIASTPENRNE